jgi:hypothetical protein
MPATAAIAFSISDQRAALNAGLKASFPEALPARAFRHANLAAMLAVWQAACGKRHLPSRADFTARLLKPYLRDIVILDVEGAGAGRRRYRHRYIGSAIVELIGEQTGRYLDELVAADEMPHWAEAFDRIVDEGEPARFESEADLAPFAQLQAESLVLPLSDDDARVNRLMTVTYFTSRET